MFGLAGAHRSGKTTTARAVAETMGIHLHETSTSKMLKEMGRDPVAKMNLDERIEVQEIILARHLEDLNNLPRPCIVDRTPLDMLGYMLGEVTMHNLTPEQDERIDRYTSDALRIVDMHYDTIVCLRPLPTFELDPTKPPPMLSYQWQIQFIIEGAGRTLRHAAVGFAPTTELDRRVHACVELFTKRIGKMVKELEEYPQH